jgi:hypothetical protein
MLIALDIPRLFTPRAGTDALQVLLWIVIGLAVAGILVHLGATIQRRASARLNRVRLFIDLVRERDVMPEDEKLLRSLAEMDETPDPYLVATNVAVFDRLSAAFLSRIEQDPAERIQQGNYLLQLRETLFFTDTSQRAVTADSRSLKVNSVVRIALPGSADLHRVTVVAVQSDHFSLTAPVTDRGPLLPKPGDRIEVLAYIPGGGGYRFRAAVQNCGAQTTPVMRCDHTSDFDRIRLREWVRVPMDIQVKFHHLHLPLSGAETAANKPAPGVEETQGFLGTHRGTLRNISLGGMSIRTETLLDEGEYVGITLENTEAVPVEKLDLLGQVVGNSEAGTARQKMYNLHIQYAGIDDLARDRLMFMLFHLRNSGKARPA